MSLTPTLKRRRKFDCPWGRQPRLDGERAGVSGEAAATWISSLEKVSSRLLPASLVWTGPEARGLHFRSTRQVFEQLVQDARKSILLGGYTYFDGPEAFKVLPSQMDKHPSLRVTVLLNINRARFNATSDRHVVERFGARLWNEDWPAKEHPPCRVLGPDVS